MTAPVDVLAVIDNFIDPAKFPHQPHDLTEARAAVAELIEAAVAFKGKRGAFMALGAQDARTLRLWAALARVGGA